jgi:hypothetical protein
LRKFRGKFCDIWKICIMLRKILLCPKNFFRPKIFWRRGGGGGRQKKLSPEKIFLQSVPLTFWDGLTPLLLYYYKTHNSELYSVSPKKVPSIEIILLL